MTDDVARLVRLLDDQGPSPEFVSMLRERIIEEARGPDRPKHDRDPQAREVHDIGIAPPRSRRGRPPTRPLWMTIGVAAAAVLVAAVVSLSALRTNDEVGTFETIDQPDLPVPQPGLLELATPLTGDEAFLDEGSYRFDDAGTTIAFTTDVPLLLERVTTASLLVYDPQRHVDRSLTVVRLSAFSNPLDPTEPFESLDDGWPADDPHGWLDRLPEGVVVAEPVDTTVGGLPAVRAELLVGELACGDRGACAYAGTNHLLSTWTLSPEGTYRFWLVEQGEYDPLLILAWISQPTDREWFDTVDQIVDTWSFGTLAPNPIEVTPAGRVSFDTFEGISIRLEDDAVIARDPRGYWSIPMTADGAGIDFVANPLDDSGEIYEAQILVDRLASQNMRMTERSAVTVDGRRTRVFDFDGLRSDTVLFNAPGARYGWATPELGRLWVIDHPDRGLLLVAARADSPGGELLDRVVAEAEVIVGSLEFS